MSLVFTGLIVTTGVGAYEAYNSNKTQSQALGLAETTQQEQEQYNSQLMQMLANPNAALENPGFQASLKQGTNSANRALAAGGFNKSGNQLTALENYGQSSAESFLTSQESLLAGLSGAGAASSPSSSLNAATGAQAQSSNQLNQLLYQLGIGGNMAFSGSNVNYGSAGDPAWGGTASGGGGYTVNVPQPGEP